MLGATLFAFACADESAELQPRHDAGPSRLSDSGPSSGLGETCSFTSDCAEGQVCAYEEGDCQGTPTGVCRLPSECPDLPEGNTFCSCFTTVFFGETGCGEEAYQYAMGRGRSCGGLPFDAGYNDGGSTGTPCGPDRECDSQSEMCVISETFAGPEYNCEPFPPGCYGNRTCECASDVCGGDPYQCVDDPSTNVVRCACPAC